MIRRENGRANQKTDQASEPKLLVKIYGPSCKQRFWQTGPAHVPYFVQTHPYPNNHTDTHREREHKDQHSYTLEKKRTRATVQKTVEFFRVLPIYTNDTRQRESAKESERAIERARDRERERKTESRVFNFCLFALCPLKRRQKASHQHQHTASFCRPSRVRGRRKVAF